MTIHHNHNSRSNKVLLLILDGWGNNPSHRHNAIAMANTPVWDRLIKTSTTTNLSASGSSVGLPDLQMGNSEVGHLCIGAGRIIPQDLVRINQTTIVNNKSLLLNIQQAIQGNHNIHILGLLSDGGVHSHDSHLHALLQLINQLLIKTSASHPDHLSNQVLLHAFLDGRDTPPKSAIKYINKLSTIDLNNIKIASIVGRFFAMDRDNRFERTKQVYDLLTANIYAFKADNPLEAIQQGYERGETDEFISPTIINNPPPILNQDLVIFYNFRTDRTRQLCYALTKHKFYGFDRLKFPKIKLLTFTKYADDIPAQVAFPPLKIKNCLSECISLKKLTQLKVAETEKYPHVTFFFNGGQEVPFAQEDRILVPSPKVKTYDLTPKMSAEKITDVIIQAILQNKYNFITANFANPDLLGHTGNLNATIAAIETLDILLNKILTIAKQQDTDVIISADHGNAELMYDSINKQPLKSHTNFPVPFVYIGQRRAKLHTISNPSLKDIAPTILNLLGIEKPKDMTGNNLLDLII